PGPTVRSPKRNPLQGRARAPSYRGSISCCPEKAWKARAELVPTLAIFYAPLVFLFVLRHRHGVNAGKPAVEVDIGAAFRAERFSPFIGGFAADRAGCALYDARHDCNMGRAIGA